MAQLTDADWPGRRDIYHQCLFPLDHTTTRNLEDYYYDEDASKPGHYMLNVKLPEPLTLEYEGNSIVTDFAPALFEIQGYIAVKDCFMTIRTNRAFRGVEDTNAKGTASCWFEAGEHMTINNQIQWDRYRAGLRELIELSDFSFDEANLSSLLSEDGQGNLRIRVCKDVTPGNEITQVIFGDHSGRLALPATALDVPYGTPYGCTFYLKYRKRRNCPPKFYAEILGIHTL